MCAQHALNMLLQGKFFSIDSLVEIAQDLDLRERAVLDDSASNQFQSQNYDDSGYFSLQVCQIFRWIPNDYFLQVITEALRRQAKIHLEPLHSPHLLHIRESPRFFCSLLIYSIWNNFLFTVWPKLTSATTMIIGLPFARLELPGLCSTLCSHRLASTLNGLSSST